MSVAIHVIEGRLTKDPEDRSKNGHNVAVFTLAVDGWGDEDASFFDCVAFEKQAEVILKFCRKGHRLMISGNIKTQRWVDTETQKKRTKAQFVAGIVNLIQPKEVGQDGHY